MAFTPIEEDARWERIVGQEASQTKVVLLRMRSSWARRRRL